MLFWSCKSPFKLSPPKHKLLRYLIPQTGFLSTNLDQSSYHDKQHYSVLCRPSHIVQSEKMASAGISSRAAYCFNTISSATAPNILFPRSSTTFCSKFSGSPLVKLVQVERKRFTKTSGKVYAVATVADDIKEFTLSSWAEFEIGQSSVYWTTENGFPPMAGEKLTVYYNPVTSKLAPNPEYGIAFNGGFNQPIMCGGEPRAMSRRDRGKVSDPFYTIKILVPKHALTLIFSFTDGTNWDGPYKLRFEVPAKWRNKAISFFNEGLAAELSQDGACERAIYAEANFVVQRCAFPANLVVEGGDRCKLDLVPGCTDPESLYFNPLANVDDGSCEIILENE